MAIMTIRAKAISMRMNSFSRVAMVVLVNASLRLARNGLPVRAGRAFFFGHAAPLGAHTHPDLFGLPLVLDAEQAIAGPAPLAVPDRTVAVRGMANLLNPLPLAASG